MKYYILAFMILVLSCSDTKNNKPNDIAQKHFTVAIKTYDEVSIPDFFRKFLNNHIADYFHKDSTTVINFCDTYGFAAYNALTVNQYCSLNILHNLFTSQNATTGSTGKILRIPYYWHWVKPNPRNEIVDRKTNRKLTEFEPPTQFNKYKSVAEIDRTPALFLSDLVTVPLKYASPLCDSFSTFGWCSEREMAFVSLVELLGFEGKVVAQGNHSWSEILVDMPSKAAKNHIMMVVKIDNTFDKIEWVKIENKDISGWRKDLGNAPLAAWYNQKAHSTIEKEKIRKYIVSKAASTMIETRFAQYTEGGLR